MLPSRNSGCKSTHFFRIQQINMALFFHKSTKIIFICISIKDYLYFCTNHEQTTIYIDSNL